MKLPKFTSSIETHRCILKIPQESEAQDMWNLITEDITKYMTWSKGPDKTATLKNIRKAMKNAKERTSWDAGIYNKTTGVLLGRCGIYKKDIEVPSFSIGYWLGNSYWGEGIIPECVQALTKYAFETGGFEKGTIRCDSMNLNSQKVAIKSGFVFEGEFKKHERIQGELRDTKFFGITKEDYFSQK